MNLEMSSMRQNVSLQGSRVCLRPPTIRDADSLAVLFRDDHTLRQELGIPEGDQPTGPDVLAKHRQWEEKNQAVTLMMVEPDGQAIGTISLSHIDEKERTGRIGYWLGSAYRKRGYATEAFGLVLQWARELGLRSVSASIEEANTPSLRIWRRFGAQEREERPGRVGCTIRPLSPDVLAFLVDQMAREVAGQFLPGPGNVERIERPGAVNHVRRVSALGTSLIVRIGRIEERTADESLEEYRKEQWCIAQARAQGIPVPQVIAVGRHNQDAYMVQRFIEGQSGDTQGTNKLAIYRQLGDYARRIHSAPIDAAGRELVDSEHLLEHPEHLREQVQYNVGQLGSGDELVRLGVYPAADAAIIAGIFESLLEIHWRFGLCHSDLSPRNVIVDRSGTIHLLDWGCATVAALPHHDMHELLVDMLQTGQGDGTCLDAFARGYGLGEEAYRQLLPEVEAYLLLKSFDVVRWAIDRKPSRIIPLAERARCVWQRCAEQYRR